MGNIDIDVMTVEEDGLEPLIQAYEQIFDVFEHNELTAEMAFSLVIRLSVQLSGDIGKEQLLSIISQAYDIDALLRSKSEEIH